MTRWIVRRKKMQHAPNVKAYYVVDALDHSNVLAVFSGNKNVIGSWQKARAEARAVCTQQNSIVRFGYLH